MFDAKWSFRFIPFLWGCGHEKKTSRRLLSTHSMGDFWDMRYLSREERGEVTTAVDRPG
jgi:hypothetical protein